MPSVQIRPIRELAREVFDTDYRGQVIRAGQAKNLACFLAVAVTAEEFCLNVPVHARIDKALVEGLNDRTGFVCKLAAREFGAELARCEALNAFTVHEIALNEKALEKESHPSPDANHADSIPCQISEQLMTHLLEQAKKDKEVRVAFDGAVKELVSCASSNAPSDFQIEISALLSFLDHCIHSGYLGALAGWYSEKQGVIQLCFADLIRRQNPRHYGFREAQDYIRGTLYSYRCPEAWLEPPPATRSVAEYLGLQ